MGGRGDGVPAGYGREDGKPLTFPERWAEVFPACGGRRQSPVDIAAATPRVLLAFWFLRR